jgi:hypothetical protein
MAGIDINTILSALPEDKKVKGLQKLGQLLIQKGVELEDQLTPALASLISQFTPGTCPDSIILQSIIEKRNNIVGKLNASGQSIETTTAAFTGVSSFLNILVLAVSNIKNIRTGLNQAAKFIPAIPGAAVSTINDLSDTSDRITFDNLGNSKLQQQKDRIESLVIPIALFSKTVQNIIASLSSLDALIVACDSTTPLEPVSQIITQTTTNQSQADENEGSYQGFIFKIEEVPFSATVTRRKAIAYNQSGIPLIETPLSFTTNNQTLIDELKLIIIRDNLKAY